MPEREGLEPRKLCWRTQREPFQISVALKPYNKILPTTRKMRAPLFWRKTVLVKNFSAAAMIILVD